MNKDIFLSIIVPTKNEESNIARCLDSLIKATSAFDKTEIILVDCSSVDKTIDIAVKYPIKILQLKPDWVHSPAAARYIGTLFASEEYIFFIDADMTLEPEFLERALDILIKNKNIAAVGGIGKEIYLKNGKEVGCRPNLYKTENMMKKADFLGGAALYRKKALIEVEGFNPYLRAAEERELAQRLRKNKYLLISIPYPAITHYTVTLGEWQEFIRKKKTNLFLGIGETMRISHSLKYLFETLLYYKEFMFFSLFILFSFILTVYSFASGKIQYIYSISLIICILFLYLVLKKRNFKTALLSLIKWFIISANIINGLITPTKNPKIYPKDPYIIKR